MSDVSAGLVKELREKTGAGMMDCKKALAESGGKMEEAIEILRKKGLKDIGKRASKVAAEGLVGVYSHAGGQVAAMVELNCETDFVGRSEDFVELSRGVAMHIAAMRPTYISEADVPVSVLDKEKEILLETLDPKQKAMADKILPGKMKKFFEDNCLLDQSYIRDDQKTVREIINEVSVKCGEKITVRRFSCFKVGEGSEKVQGDFLAEVEAAISGN
jgi:elongation factor Ts